MGKFLLWLISTLMVMMVWTALMFFGTQGGWFKAPIVENGDLTGFKAAVREKVDANFHGNLGYALIENAQVVDQYFVSNGTAVNQDTVFQVASISKWITAWGVMTLIEDGKLDLDKPVSTYLTRWQLPASDFDNNGVTIRRILSHTAGLTDGLGFSGYADGVEVPNITQALSNPNASSPQGDRRIRVGKEPGSAWAYSGGGYAILQLVIEEVTGESFIPFMQQNVLNPLGMKHSRYVIDSIDTNVAPSYTVDGRIVPRQNWINYLSSSFYTSVADMTRFVQAHFKGINGQPVGRNVLSATSITSMAEPHASTYGMDIWGMGPVLWAPRSLSENRTRAEGKLV